jgi:hypothetical protein
VGAAERWRETLLEGTAAVRYFLIDQNIGHLSLLSTRFRVAILARRFIYRTMLLVFMA